MARPKKNNADYFSHDNDMRNDRKIKALRSKFGIVGYGVWCMLLEFITSSNNNEITDDEIEIELMAGDFGVSSEDLAEIIDYCCKVKLLIKENGVLYSQSLKDRLAPVYAKRENSQAKARQQPRKNGKFKARITEDTDASVAETPKQEHISINIGTENYLIFESLKKTMDQFISDQSHLEPLCMKHKCSTIDEMKDYVKAYFVDQTCEGRTNISITEAKQHFKNWLPYHLEKQQKKQEGGQNESRSTKRSNTDRKSEERKGYIYNKAQRAVAETNRNNAI